jgi:hypothetical protein
MMEKVKTSVSFDKDVYEFIQKLAADDRTSVSQVINKKFLDLMKEKDKQ